MDKALFEETSINGMTLRNRLVRSATWEGMCETDGCPTEELCQCYAALARGGIGLIISGYAFVRSEGKQLPGKMGIHTDDFAEQYQRLTNIVHEASGTIAIQLVHAGGQTTAEHAGRQPLAPSAVKVEQFPELPAELTKAEITNLGEAFASAAARAKAWGFDGVQLHGAHGYLISQFLSPLANRRGDEYGGGIENRSRFLFEVYHKVREAVGGEYPVMIKFNASDHLEGGFEIEDALYTARELSSAGIDAIEISAGTPASGIRGPARVRINKAEKEAYNVPLAQRIKEAVDCPVIAVGGFRSYQVVERALLQDGMDYIAMSRPLIGEPDLARRWLDGDHSPANCISCNGCFKPGREEQGIYCVNERRKERGS